MPISDNELACLFAGATTAGVILSMQPPLSQGIAIATLALSTKLPLDLYKSVWISYSLSMVGLLSYKLIELYSNSYSK